MDLETDKIRIELTKSEYLQKIIDIEQENSEFVGQYNYNEHMAVIENENELHFSIFDKSDDLLTGYIILAGIKNANDSIEFRRIVISNKSKGLGKDSVKLVKKYCFDKLKAHRIWLDVYSDNSRAIRLYKSQGFRIEGLLRDSIKLKDKYRSLYIMSLLKNDLETDILGIDHVCLIVKDINETKNYLQSLFDLDIRIKPDSEFTLMCENRHLHFFVKQMQFPAEFLREQHLSMKVDNLDLIRINLEQNRISFEIGEFNGFIYNNYKWIEWRDINGIRFECVEQI